MATKIFKENHRSVLLTRIELLTKFIQSIKKIFSKRTKNTKYNFQKIIIVSLTGFLQLTKNFRAIEDVEEVFWQSIY